MLGRGDEIFAGGAKLFVAKFWIAGMVSVKNFPVKIFATITVSRTKQANFLIFAVTWHDEQRKVLSDECYFFINILFIRFD